MNKNIIYVLKHKIDIYSVFPTGQAGQAGQASVKPGLAYENSLGAGLARACRLGNA